MPFHWRYRLQNNLFALRRYLPGPLRQALKPVYRRWWQRAARRKRQLALAAQTRADSTPGFAIVCLAGIDWELRYQRPQQLLSRMAMAGRPVYYLRTDFGARFSPDSLEWLAPNVHGLRLPGPSRMSLYGAPPGPAWVERWVRILESVAQSQMLADVVVLVHSPFWTPLALALKQQFGWRLVYDCMDEHAGFASAVPEVVAGEAALLADSDLVLATARLLYERCAAVARRCVLLPNAADEAHFGQAAPLPTDLPRPIVGYFGALAEWFEPDWIEAAAQAHPDWSFVLIGLKSGADLRRLERQPNVHLLGEVPYAALPGWLHAFDAAVIPFKLNPLTRATNPVKFYEYLAAGKPVVAAALPELAPHAALHYPAGDQAEFLRQLEAAVTESDPALPARRLAFARANTWEERVADFERQVSGLFGEAVIIMVSFNNREYLQLCLESIWARTEYPRFRVVVVDNASGPDVVAYLQAEQARQPRLSVIYNPENAGFARANNQGLAAVGEAEYVVLLNDDTVVTRGWLSRLVAHLRADPQLGLVGPLTNWASNAAKITTEYDGLDLGRLEAFAARQTVAHLGRRHPTQRLDMFCTALRRQVAQEIGPLDEAYGLGMFEDDDYALRLKRAGYRLAIAADVFVHHWGWSSFGQLDQADYDRIFEANRRYYEQKWRQRWQRPPLRLESDSV
jgi:GT2 family glycosyltransferase/glycosyltransferase involved in cell wall biosynthesis